MKQSVWSPVLVLTLGAFVSTWATPSAAAHGAPEREYVAHFHPLNGSGVTGTAHLTLEGDQLRVEIQACGLEPHQVHPQHIHGFEHRNAVCPPMSADSNHDGILTLEEGLPFYGPIMLALMPFPTADANGCIHYAETFTITVDEFRPLQSRTMVLHGMTVNGTYWATLPVACAEIQVAAPGREKQHDHHNGNQHHNGQANQGNQANQANQANQGNQGNQGNQSKSKGKSGKK